jgi:hypothetical protein
VLASLIARARGRRGFLADSKDLGSVTGVSLVALGKAIGRRAALVKYVKVELDKFGPRTPAVQVPAPRELEPAELAESTPILRFDYASTVDLGSMTGTPGRYLAIVVWSGESICAELLDVGSAESIENDIRAYKELANEEIKLHDSGVPSSTRSDELGCNLRAAILDPVTCRAQKCSTLYLVPDGMIAGIPPEGLPTGAGDAVIDRQHRLRVRQPDEATLVPCVAAKPGSRWSPDIKRDASLRSIPIIAVTSYALSGEGQKAREARCDDYVSKPYSPQPPKPRPKPLPPRPPRPPPPPRNQA